MKKIIIISLLICLLLTGCSSNTKITLNGEEVHFFKQEIINTNYEIEIPTTFLQLNDEMLELKYGDSEHADIVFVSPEADGEFTIDDTELTMSEDELSKYLEILLETFEESSIDFHFITKEIVTKEAKKLAILEFSYSENNKNYYELLMYFVENDTLMEIRFSMYSDEVDNLKPVGNYIKNSFHKKEAIEDVN